MIIILNHYKVVLVLIILPILGILYCACKSTMPTSSSVSPVQQNQIETKNWTESAHAPDNGPDRTTGDPGPEIKLGRSKPYLTVYSCFWFSEKQVHREKIITIYLIYHFGRKPMQLKIVTTYTCDTVTHWFSKVTEIRLVGQWIHYHSLFIFASSLIIVHRAFSVHCALCPNKSWFWVNKTITYKTSGILPSANKLHPIR